MGIITIDNQPIVFNKTTNICAPCAEVQEPVVRYDKNDTIPILIKLSPCPNAENIIRNGSFSNSGEWVTSGNATLSGGKLIKTAGATGQAQQQNVFLWDEIYEVNITVDVLQGGSIRILSGIVVAKTINSAGTYKFLVNGANVDITIDFNNANTVCEISDISAYIASANSGVRIRNDATGAIIFTDYIRNLFTCLSDSFVLLEFDAPQDKGCYYIELVDACKYSCLTFGSPDRYFLNENNWDITVNTGNPTLTFGDGLLYEDTDGNGNVNICFYQNICEGYEYQFYFFLVEAINVEVSVTINGSTVYLANTDGQHSFYYEAQEDATLCININSIGENATVLIEEFDVFISHAIGIVEETHKSQKVIIDDYSSNCKMKKVAICNNNDANGFSACFKPFAWFECDLINPKHISNERIVYDLNNGTKRLQYSEKVKEYEFRADISDPFSIDFLSLIPISHSVYINNESYFSNDDEIQLNYSIDAPDYSTVSIKMIEQKGLINVNLTNDSNCTASNFVAVIKPNGTDLLGDGEQDNNTDVVVGMTRN